MSSYIARMSFIDPLDRSQEHSHEITYTVLTGEIIGDAMRWVRNRQRTGMFGILGAIKISLYSINRVRLDGYLPPNEGAVIFEWKYDWGTPAPDGRPARWVPKEVHHEPY